MERNETKGKMTLFKEVFTNKNNLTILHKEFHPNEDIKPSDIQLVELDRYLSECFDDVGFIANGRLIILTEQLEKDDPNLAARMFVHAAKQFEHMILEANGQFFSKNAVELPTVEFHSLYVGKESVSDCSRQFANNLQVEIKVHDCKSASSDFIKDYYNLINDAIKYVNSGYPKNSAAKMSIMGVSSDNSPFSIYSKNNNEKLHLLLCEKLDKIELFKSRIAAEIAELSEAKVLEIKEDAEIATIRKFIERKRKKDYSDEDILSEVVEMFEVEQSKAIELLATV